MGSSGWLIECPLHLSLFLVTGTDQEQRPRGPLPGTQQMGRMSLVTDKASDCVCHTQNCAHLSISCCMFAADQNLIKNFPCGSVIQSPPANAGDAGWIPGSRRSPRVGNGNPLQYSCLGNPMDRGAWGAIVHGVAKESDKTQ